MQRWANLVVGMLLLCIGTLTLIYVAFRAVRFLTLLNQPLSIAILAACATILASTITVVAGKIIERKTETEAHFRQRKFDQYYELLKLLYELAQQTGEAQVDNNVVKRLNDWQRNLILFAGPKTIRSYVAWLSNLKSGNMTLRTIMLMEEFYKSLRSDLGISNFGLQHGDLAQLILRHGDLFVAMAEKDPNMPLAKFVQLEKTLETATPSSA
jgi:hypothetical protein